MAVKDKVRGSKKALKKLIADFESVDVDFNEPIVLLDLLNEDVYFELKKYFEEKNIEYIDAKVGCTVGIHSGVKPCGLFFIVK